MTVEATSPAPVANDLQRSGANPSPKAPGAANAASAAPAVSVRGLTKRYGRVLALDALDLDVPAGSVFGLLGRDGAGKTTAIRVLAGLRHPTRGRVSLLGLDVGSARTDRAELRRRIGVLDQEPGLYAWMTGRQLLEFVGDLLGLARRELPARVDETLERIGLSGEADRRIATYGPGMRQRLGLGQAILGRPQLLLLDEPASSLDPDGRRELLALIGGLRDMATIVLSSHLLSDVEGICDRVAILDRGRLMGESTVTALIERHGPPAYRIEVEPGQAPGVRLLVEALGRQPWVTGVEIARDLMRVQVADRDVAAMRLVPLLGTSGLRIAAVQRERPSLEDVLRQLADREAVP